MKFTIINSPALVKTLSSLKAVTCKKGSIPVLENVSIVSLDAKTLKLSATDLDVTLNCQIEAIVFDPFYSSPGSETARYNKDLPEYNTTFVSSS